MMRINGHLVESHSVQTEDGYILQILRIPIEPIVSFPELISNMEDGLRVKSKPAVLLVHGINSCGPTWLLNSPDKVLPCKLVVEGYDCWIACLRGGKASQGHSKLTTKSSQYWNYSAHEIGLYDIPAMMDYILTTTGNSSLYYIGHSLGCTVFFIAMAKRPEYGAKVKVMIAMSPAMYGKHINNFYVKAAGQAGKIVGKFPYLYQRDIFRSTFDEYAKKFCPPCLNSETFGVWMMYQISEKFEALGPDQVEESRKVTLTKHLSSPASIKMFCHVAQCLLAGQAQEYDYGRADNLKRYGQPLPPKYELKHVTMPVVTFGALDDKLVTAKDVLQLASELPNLMEHREIREPNFTHADFQFGKDADKLVFDPIIQIFHQFEKRISTQV